MELCGGFGMGEKHLGSCLAATPPFFELLHEDLADDDVVIVHEDGGEDYSDTVLLC